MLDTTNTSNPADPSPATDGVVDADVAQVEGAIARVLGQGEGEGVMEEAVAIPPLSYITIPAPLLRAALLCVATDEGRPYLHGVRLSRVGRDVQVAATNGHLLFVGSHPLEPGNFGPDWLGTGLTLPAHGLKARLALIQTTVEKDERAMVRVGFANGAYAVNVTDYDETMIFRMQPVDGSFPLYSRVLEQIEAMGDRTFSAAEAVLYNPTILRGACDVSAALRGGAVALFEAPADGDGVQGASIVTFQAAPGCALVMMPATGRVSLPEETTRVLAPALKGTLAAIKANLTRTEARLATGVVDDAERDRLEAKCMDYRTRISVIEAGAESSGMALPAPEAEPVAAASVAPPKKGKGKGKSVPPPVQAEAGHPMPVDA